MATLLPGGRDEQDVFILQNGVVDAVSAAQELVQVEIGNLATVAVKLHAAKLPPDDGPPA